MQRRNQGCSRSYFWSGVVTVATSLRKNTTNIYTHLLPSSKWFRTIKDTNKLRASFLERCPLLHFLQPHTHRTMDTHHDGTVTQYLVSLYTQTCLSIYLTTVISIYIYRTVHKIHKGYITHLYTTCQGEKDMSDDFRGETVASSQSGNKVSVG